MGGRRIKEQSAIRTEHPKLPQPLTEEKISVDRLFEIVGNFALAKKKQVERLKQAQESINKIYSTFELDERVRFFSMLYDRFAESGYDEHMGVHTGHYRAIKRVMGYASPYLKYPILDITAGTGEPLKYALEFIDREVKLGEYKSDGHLLVDVHANEISEKMASIAKTKLGLEARFSNFSAFDLPDEFAGKFNTVLCSQTFHLIPDEDKVKLVRSIQRALAPGGAAVVIEEDPFKISQTPPMEAISLFLRSIVRPIKPRKLIGYFEIDGFVKLEETASCQIDSDHSMHLHIFVSR